MMPRTFALFCMMMSAVAGSSQCIADFVAAANWDTVSFTNLSSATNAYYYWNFGDGSTSYESDPVHVFIEAGTFQVTLHVRDTVSLCHSVHQEWMSITRPQDEVCEPFMTDSLFTYNGSDYAQITDEAFGCSGMNRYIDCMGAQNFPPGNWFNLTGWEHALTMARIRYISHDSIVGTVFRRAYYRTIPYNQDPANSHDICSADFEYVIDYQPGGAVTTFKPLGSAAADTIWVSGFGNPIPLIGPVSTFTFPYQSGPSGKWQNVSRRNRDPAYGCNNRQAHTMIIKNPYYVAPPTCLIDTQPMEAIVYQNGSAQFFISSQPGSFKQWQQNAGLGWQDLFNAGPYSGVHTDTLTIANCQNWWTGYQYRCVVTAPGNNCHNTSSVAALTVAVGIEGSAYDPFMLYPNPATDAITLHWNNAAEPALLRIFDGVGSLVRSERTNGQTSVIDLTGLSPGLYLLTTNRKGEELRSRFIKK
jgi:hypothetical protein